MSQAPAMPMFWGDYWSKTRKLTPAQHHAYLFLLGATWMNNCEPFADDDAVLSRVIGISVKAWKAVRPALVGFFDLSDGRWRNQKLEGVWAAVSRKIEANRKNGPLGGRPKKPVAANPSAPRQAPDAFPPGGSQQGVEVFPPEAGLAGKLEQYQAAEKPNGFAKLNPTGTQPKPNQNQRKKEVSEKERLTPDGVSAKKSADVVNLAFRWPAERNVPIEWIGEGYAIRPEVDGYTEASGFKDYFTQAKGREVARDEHGWRVSWRNWVRRARPGARDWIDRYGHCSHLHRRADGTWDEYVARQRAEPKREVG